MNCRCCCKAETNNKVSPDSADANQAKVAQNGIQLEVADLIAIQETMGQESFQISQPGQPSNLTTSGDKSGVSYYAGEIEKGDIAPVDARIEATEAPDQGGGGGGGTQSTAMQVQVTHVSFHESLAHDVNISGMKQICGNSINCCRRFLWMLVLVLMVTLLFLNINRRVMYFHSFPTGTKTEILYKQRIQFPSVTICNMNLVRATGAYRLNQHEQFPQRRNLVTMYEAVTQFFETLDYYNEEEVEIYLDKYMDVWNECYEADCVESVGLAAHHKEDLIHECEWRGRECFAENFTMVVTDVGTCYTWNGGEDDQYIHHAESAGPTGGLRLVLNIEQYEYMRSQREVAGAYGVVADQGESTAEISGKGFTISKGTYTSAALSRTLHIDLEEPFSHCHEGMAISECLLLCLSDYIVEQCGCKEAYMIGDVEICKVDEYLRCLYPKKREFPSLTNYTDYCGHCRPACNRTQFDITLSQSPMSEFYAKRMSKDVLSDFDVMYDFREAIRQQDWVLLHFANSSYTDLVFEIAGHISLVYQHTVNIQSVVLHNTTVLLTEIEDSGLVDNDLLVDVKNNVTALWEIHADLVHHTRYHYLFNYMLAGEHRRGEELNVRLACDMVQTGTGHTQRYARMVNESMVESMDSLEQVQQAWDMFMEDVQTPLTCGATNRASGWNDTMYTYMFALKTSFDKSLAELDTAVQLYSTNAPAIQQDPAIMNRSISTQPVSDRDFYLHNFARVDIFYQEMAYTRNEQYESYDFPALICDVGGNLGLYLGGSLLTVVELIDVICISIFTCCGCCARRRRRQGRRR